MKKIKILQLSTVILFAFIILITIIGLYLIWFSGFSYKTNIDNHRFVFHYDNGFSVLKNHSLTFVINHSAHSCYLVTKNPLNYYPWIRLQIGVILCTIVRPILLYITILFITIILIFKIKYKNNNFWDVIKNCEIINNYYIH